MIITINQVPLSLAGTSALWRHAARSLPLAKLWLSTPSFTVSFRRDGLPPVRRGRFGIGCEAPPPVPTAGRFGGREEGVAFVGVTRSGDS
jgi:hypothetical protein